MVSEDKKKLLNSRKSQKIYCYLLARIKICIEGANI